MAIKFEKIKVGDVLWDTHTYGRGNTTQRAHGWWTVKIISIDAERRSAKVRWNGNPEETWYDRSLEKLYRNKGCKHGKVRCKVCPPEV